MTKYLIRQKLGIEEKMKFGDYPELLSLLLLSRGMKSKEEADDFLNPDFEKNHDPFLMKDMEKTVVRMKKVIDKNEKVVIFSDYDADGISGAVVLYDFFEKIGFKNFENYIPHRVMEGFGLNKDAVEEFSKKDVKLIITIDCGIADVEEAKLINEKGIDLIITDHHLVPKKIPEAYAILDPKRKDCDYPEKMLCGSGVVFKFVQAMISKYGEEFKIKNGWEKWLLDMVGLGTISDMVPLVGENRIFAHYGLKVLRKSPRLGLVKLLRILKIDQSRLSEDDIGFMISPRINAASRMGKPEDAFKLLITKDEDEAEVLARHLDKINSERKGVVASIVKEIKKKISERSTESKRKVLVAGNPDWKPSLLGLVANSLLDDHDGPVFLWGREDGKNLKGSCRSDGCVDLVEMMKEAGDVFVEFGGHKMSGGFTLAFEKISLLEERLEMSYKKIAVEMIETGFDVDAEVNAKDVNVKNYKILEKLSPFGAENEKPIFLWRNLRVVSVKKFGKENNHLELVCEGSDGGEFKAISFFSSPETWGEEIKIGDAIDLIGNLEFSNFRNRGEVRVRVVELEKK
ncbi:MAG: single-stranded-DNA-specific exonuclease RecJ [Minisyncoccia bacterium]